MVPLQAMLLSVRCLWVTACLILVNWETAFPTSTLCTNTWTPWAALQEAMVFPEPSSEFTFAAGQFLWISLCLFLRETTVSENASER